MAKVKKSTKKFLQKKSSGRKLFHKKPEWKRRGPAEDDQEEEEVVPTGKDVAQMDVDEFLEGAFLKAGSDSDGAGGDDDDESDGDSDLADGFLGSDDDNEGINGVAESDATSDENDDENAESSEEDADTAGVVAQNRRLKNEVSAHKAQLEKLREADPEFYDYLASTDKELLEFGQEESESGGDEADDSEEDGATPQVTEGVKALPEAQEATVTLKQVDAWCRAAKEDGSLGAIRSLLRAYRVACHYGDSEESVDEGMRIGSSAVYNTLMLFVLKEVDGILRTALGVGPTIEAGALKKAQRWKKVEPLMKSYLGNTLHLLGHMTDPGMLAFILRRVRSSVIFLAPFAKIQRRYLKTALQIFGSAEHAPRVQAILLVRSMALALPLPAMDACLKGVYRAFASNAKFVNAASTPLINFMAAAVVEMYALDATAAYQHAFGFIRQLAVLLRQAVTSKSKDSYREVYCWQTINCLELWANVLSSHGGSEDMRPLVYPVAQLLLGSARLVPTPAYFPLRLRCARALNSLAQSAGVFIPIAPLLLEILQWRDLARPPKPAPGDKTPEIFLQLRVGKSAMRSSGYQEEIVEQVMELLAGHLAQWGYHVSFPELAHLPLAQLRRFAKTTSVERFRRSARQLADALERNIAFVGCARDQIDFSPKDLAQVGLFMAKESASKAAPVVQHAATLQERAKQRLALRAAQDVEIGAHLPGTGGVAMKNLGNHPVEEEEEEEEPEGDFLPTTTMRKPPGAKRLRDWGDGFEEPQASPLRSKKKGGKKNVVEDVQAEYESDDALDRGVEDEVGEYRLSDDEEEDQAGKPPVTSARGSRGKGGGNGKGKKGKR